MIESEVKYQQTKRMKFFRVGDVGKMLALWLWWEPESRSIKKLDLIDYNLSIGNRRERPDRITELELNVYWPHVYLVSNIRWRVAEDYTQFLPPLWYPHVHSCTHTHIQKHIYISHTYNKNDQNWGSPIASTTSTTGANFIDQRVK